MGNQKKVISIDADEHEQLCGAIYYFEHVIAFALTNMGEDPCNPGMACEDYIKGGRSLLATTRISGSSAQTWLPIFKENKDIILETAQNFDKQLDKLEKALDDERDLALMLSEACYYRQSFDDEKRETIEGELFDYYQSMKDCFNKSVRKSVVSRVILPSFIGAAITMNAKEIDECLPNISVAEHADTSFKDGTAPMVTDQYYLTGMLRGNKSVLRKQLKEFRNEFDYLVNCIKDQDQVAIRAYIEKANSIRACMPPKADPATVREEYAFILS